VGVTLQQLCVEYQQAAIDANDGRRPYQYSQFCDLYDGWKAKLDVPMRQPHRAGEKAFIDYLLTGTRTRGIPVKFTGEERA